MEWSVASWERRLPAWANEGIRNPSKAPCPRPDAASLAQGHPFALPAPPPRYHTFDAMLLQVLQRRGELGKSIFLQLFRRNPIQRIFRFLDEDADGWENLRLLITVPPGPFIRA